MSWSATVPGWSARSPFTPTTSTTTTPAASGEVNFADRGLQLSRGFRALKVWVSVQTFGLAAFRAAVQRNLDLAEFAETLVRGHPDLTLMAPAMLGIVCFRREWPGCDEAETERRGLALAECPGTQRDGAGLQYPAGRPPRHPALRAQPDQLRGGRAPGHRAFRRGLRPGQPRARPLRVRGGAGRFPGRRPGRPGRRSAAHLPAAGPAWPARRCGPSGPGPPASTRRPGRR